MVSAGKANCLDNVLEHEGLLWKPKQGATSSAEEFLAARKLFMELHDEWTWNPWILEDKTEDLERAQEVMGNGSVPNQATAP